MKYVIYTGSRNLYKDMAVAATRLLSRQNHPEEYTIFLGIEDDELVYPVPDNVKCINVSETGKHMFIPNGPNMNTEFTYLAMIRAAYPSILPKDIDKILQLDVDTVVMGDLSDLWDVDISNAYFAAVLEYRSTYKPYGKKYFNAGVMMINLAKMYEDHIDTKMVTHLNTKKVPYIDQDTWNLFGIKNAVELPVEYNETVVTGYTDHPKIVHYAGFKWHGEEGSEKCPRLEHYRESMEEYEDTYAIELF